MVRMGEDLSPATRKVVGSVAALGVAETAFLTFNKAQAGSFCASVSCSQVLSGPWSKAFGVVPLSVLGLLSYVVVLLFAVAPLALPSSDDEVTLGSVCEEEDGGIPAESATLETLSHKSLVAVTSGMAVFSGYLVSVLLFKLHATCLWCFGSAALSMTLVVLVNKPLQHVKIGVSGATVASVFAGALYLFTSTETALAENMMMASEPQGPPTITQHSSKRALVLAEKLKAQNAKMYGAFWCSHCFDQKQTLGMEAMKTIPYLECAPNGVESKTSLCRERDIPGYPTWEINGELHPGEMSLEELEEMVGIRPALVQLPGM